MNNHILSMLFSRLTWPSALVRERACVSIADLLGDPKHGTLVFEQLLEWIQSQKLESRCILGLLALCRARDQFQMTFDGNQIWKAISRPSILAWALVNEIDEGFLEDFNSSLGYSQPTTVELNHHEIFEKHSNTYIPGKYSIWADAIERNEKIPFTLIWESEWHQVLKEVDVTLSESPFRYWMGYQRDNEIIADTLLSDVYISAFLRALAQCVAINHMDFGDAILLAAKSSPIDLALWKITPSQCPQWWPQIVEINQEIDTTISDIWKKVEELWASGETISEDNCLIASASGSIAEKNTIYCLKIMGLFQKAHGPSTPNLEEIATWYENDGHVKLEHNNPLRFSGFIYPSDDCIGTFNDWSILAVSNYNQRYSRWQHWRSHGYLWLPSACLAERPIRFKLEPDRIQIFEANRNIGYWQDWNQGVKEKHNRLLPDPNGQVLWLDRALINDFSAATSSNYCWLCKLTRYDRKDQYSDPTELFSDYKLFGASNVVRVS